MNAVQIPDNERLLDLLAEEATVGLSDADLSALEAMIAEDGEQTGIEPDAFAEAAAACTLMWADPSENVPSECRSKLITAAEKHIATLGTRELKLTGTPADAQLRSNPLITLGGWAAAAACLIVAVVVSTQPEAAGSTLASADRSASERVAELVANDPAITRAAWLSIDQVPPLNADAPHRFDEGITGEVIWSEDRDQGYMRLSGLTSNNPEEWVYQLWIFDKTRDAGDLTQRPVDGGVFNFDAAKRDPKTGDVLVPINAKLPVGEAFLFAVTVEKPGGAVVSDRDVVFVAALG